MSAVLLVAHVGNISRKMLGCLHRAGHEVDVLSIGRQTLGLGRSRFVRSFHAVEQQQYKLLVAEVSDWIAANERSRGWSAVLGDDLFGHKLLFEVAPNVGTPVFAPTSPERLEAIYDKWSFYNLVKDVPGVRVPHSVLVPGPDSDASGAGGAIGYPLLVKPLAGEGGHGIARMEGERELRSHLSARDPDEYPLKLQRLIRGPTIGMSLLARRGIIAASDIQVHRADGAREIYSDSEVEDMGSRIVSALNYGGPGHIDFVREAATGALYAIEFNCRFWSSVEVSNWLGGNFPALAVDLVQGKRIPLHPTRPGVFFQAGVVAQKVRRPWELLTLGSPTWGSIAQALSDPGPLFADIVRRHGWSRS